MFDIVHDPQHAQPRFALMEEGHHHIPHPASAEQHKEQHAEEYENLADRRRYDANRRLQD